jgi:hypothetical protein
MFQHRLHPGIVSPYESRRTVDQVPLLGEWSHIAFCGAFSENYRTEKRVSTVT